MHQKNITDLLDQLGVTDPRDHYRIGPMTELIRASVKRNNLTEMTKHSMLLMISSNSHHVATLLRIAEVPDHPRIQENALIILRACIASKAVERNQALDSMLDLGATQKLAAILASSSATLSIKSLSLIFWILKALTAKDARFSLNFGFKGALKLIPSFIDRFLACQSSSYLYPTLQVLRALARNPKSARLLCKLGAVESIFSIINFLALECTSHVIKVKIALTALASLCGCNKVEIWILVQAKGLETLLHLLEILQPTKETFKVYDIVSMLLLLIASKEESRSSRAWRHGKEVLCSLCCDPNLSEGRWQRVKNRIFNIICKCFAHLPLPVTNEECPKSFALPMDPADTLSNAPDTETDTEEEMDDVDDSEENEVGNEEDEDIELEGFAENVETVLVLPEEEAEFIHSLSSNNDTFKNLDDVARLFKEFLPSCSDERVTIDDQIKPDLIQPPIPHFSQMMAATCPDLEVLHRQKCQISCDTIQKVCFSDIPDQRQQGQVVFDIENDNVGDIPKDSIQFESRFECGNLRKAIMVSKTEYQLILCPDANSKRNQQWFFFQVKAMSSDQVYTFHVINMEKANSQFRFGMQPLLFSAKDALKQPRWFRSGFDIAYQRNLYRKSFGNRDPYLTLSFSMTFPHEDDVCYIAYHYPYPYTFLMDRISFWHQSITSDILFRQDCLVHSLGNNPVPLLTITSRRGLGDQQQTIILTSRVHPGETNSSWIMDGMINFLLSDDPAATALRVKFVFKVIPMLNVDGVIFGCQRMGLSGEDLNRRWLNPNETLHPEIFQTKKLLSFMKERLDTKPFIFCDIHGHSRRKNVFLYGCSPDQSWLSCDSTPSSDSNKKTLQTLEDILIKDDVGFDSRLFRFTIEKSRESTARVVVWRQYGVDLSFTLETTFNGFNVGRNKGQHVNIHHLKMIGESFLKSLLNLRCVTNGSRLV